MNIYPRFYLINCLLFIAVCAVVSCKKNKQSVKPNTNQNTNQNQNQPSGDNDTLIIIKGMEGAYRWYGVTKWRSHWASPPYLVYDKDTFDCTIKVKDQTTILWSHGAEEDTIKHMILFDTRDSIAVFVSWRSFYRGGSYDTVTYDFGANTLRFGGMSTSKNESQYWEYYSPARPEEPKTCMEAMGNISYAWKGFYYTALRDPLGNLYYKDTTQYGYTYQLLVFNDSVICTGQYWDYDIDTLHKVWQDGDLSCFTGYFIPLWTGTELDFIKDSVTINCSLKTMYWHHWEVDSLGNGQELIMHYP